MIVRLLFVCVLAQALRADGGTVLSRTTQGDYTVTAFQSGSELSLLIQKTSNGSSVLDAAVCIEHGDKRTPAMLGRGRYVATVSSPGTYILAADLGAQLISVPVNVQSLPQPTPLLYALLVPIAILGFALNRFLARRRKLNQVLAITGEST